MRDLRPQEVEEIYDVREELEVMAVRILPFPVRDADIAKLEAIQHAHGKAVDAGDLLAVFQSNVLFHRALFGLCGNTSLIETIESLAQKVSGIRSYAHAKSEALNDARRDHIAMIKALRNSRRDDLMSLTRRHLKPAVRAYDVPIGGVLVKADPNCLELDEVSSRSHPSDLAAPSLQTARKSVLQVASDVSYGISKQLSIVRSSVSLAFRLDNSDGRSPDRIEGLATDDYPTPSPSDAARTARFCHV